MAETYSVSHKQMGFTLAIKNPDHSCIYDTFFWPSICETKWSVFDTNGRVNVKRNDRYHQPYRHLCRILGLRRRLL